MKVTAMLAWWNEPPWLLTQCVRSLAPFCDAVVAVDGAWELVDGGKAKSPKAQGDAIEKAAREAGLDADVYVPDGIWPGQVSKRSAMIALAAKDSDWVISVDSDHMLTGDPEAFRTELAASDADCFRVKFFTPLPDGFDLDRAPHDWHRSLAGKTTLVPLLFYAYESMRFEDRHFHVSALREGRRIAIVGCNGRYPPGVTDDLRAPFVVEHRCFDRPQELLDRNRDFCLKRDALYRTDGFET